MNRWPIGAGLIALAIVCAAVSINPVPTLIFVFVAGGTLALAYFFRAQLGIGQPPPTTPITPAALVPSAETQEKIRATLSQLLARPAATPQTFQIAPHVEPWHAPAHAFAERMGHAIAETMKGLGSFQIRNDPLLTIQQSHLVAVLHSAIARHGFLIEAAIFQILSDYERYQAWPSQKLNVSDGRGGTRPVQVDLIVYDKKENVIRAYEIKRGSSDNLGSHTERQTRENLPLIESLLPEFAAKHGYRAERAVTHVLSYYGKTVTQAVGGPTLTEHTLDEHFEIPNMRAAIEAVNASYKARIQKFLADEGLWEHDTPRVAEAAE